MKKNQHEKFVKRAVNLIFSQWKIYTKIWSNFQDDIWVFCIVNSEILFCKNEFKKLKKKRKTNIENSMKCPKIFLMELSIPLNDRQNKWINREVEILIFDHQKITEVELKKKFNDTLEKIQCDFEFLFN